MKKKLPGSKTPAAVKALARDIRAGGDGGVNSAIPWYMKIIYYMCVCVDKQICPRNVTNSVHSKRCVIGVLLWEERRAPSTVTFWKTSSHAKDCGQLNHSWYLFFQLQVNSHPCYWTYISFLCVLKENGTNPERWIRYATEPERRDPWPEHGWRWRTLKRGAIPFL